MVQVSSCPLCCPPHSQKLPSPTTASAEAPPNPLLPQAPAAMVRLLLICSAKTCGAAGPTHESYELYGLGVAVPPVSAGWLPY